MDCQGITEYLWIDQVTRLEPAILGHSSPQTPAFPLQQILTSIMSTTAAALTLWRIVPKLILNTSCIYSKVRKVGGDSLKVGGDSLPTAKRLCRCF